MILLIFTTLYSILSAQVHINELMSSNSNVIYDEFGESSDWIELYNSGSNPINLGGYGLSDDLDDLYKWTFPSVTINPNSHLLIFASGVGGDNNVQHWETVVNWGDTWNYFIGEQEPPLNWKEFGFIDDNWMSGSSGFGYGDGDDATIVPSVMSVFVRKSFYIESLEDILEILLHVDYDDGFVAYINGVEIARSNIGDSSDGPPPYNQGADEWREAEIYSGGLPERFDIDIDIESISLQEGENLLAIQVHNYDQASSDMSLIPFLTLGLNYIPNDPMGAPEILNLGSSSLHTNFKISSSGEQILLSDLSENIIDEVDSLVIPTDISYGRQPDGEDLWMFFEEPTPNQTNNNSSGFESSCQTPSFSLDAGFFDESIEVTIELTEEGYPIYYTLDGSDPTTSSSVYLGPISITQTTVLRASMIHPNCLFSETSTSSYFINENMNLPIISLTSDPYNLWDEEYGIYAMGSNASQNFPYFGANFWEDWERSIYIEFFEPNGMLGFAQDAGVKIFGGWSRGLPQKSLAIYARPGYGMSEINYQIFPDKEIDSFAAIVLRNSGNEWFGSGEGNATMFRDGMHTSLMDNTGVEHQEYRPAAVYINGEYWGIHNIREKVNEEFLASNNPGVDPDELDELEFGGDIIEGDNQDYLNMIDFVENNDLSNPDNYLIVEEQVNIENFIDYYIIQIYVGNIDWPGNNIKFWRPHIEGARWKWILYDTDFGFGLFPDWASNVYHNTLLFALDDNGPGWPNPPWSTLLFRSLMENEEFQNKFINHFCYYLSTRFEPSYVENHISDIVNNIAPEMPNHISRWGGNMVMWNQNINYVQNFGTLRADIVFNHIGNYFGLNESSTLNLSVNPTDAGSIFIADLIIPGNTWSGEYFNGIPIEISAFSNPGYTFSHWIGENSSNQSISVTLDGNQYMTAVFIENDSQSVLVINELLADNESTNIDEEGEYEDWVELYFNIPGLITLDGYFLTDDLNEPEKWSFPDIELSGEGHLLIWTDDDEEDGYLHTNFNLSAEGESVALFDSNLNLIDYIEFGEQSEDVSFGRTSDGNEEWIFFNQPTPEAPNYQDNPCEAGDINCDGELNVLDVVQLVAFILGNSELTDVQQQLGDLNFDETIDVLDVILMISIILEY